MKRLPILVIALMLAFVARTFAIDTMWTGAWQFHEFAPPNQSWAYGLVVKPDGTARLAVDGFQTAIRFSCDVKVQGDTAGVYFRKAEAGNAGMRYKPGTLLFSLTRNGADAPTTTWAAMKPMLPASQKTPVAWKR